MAGQSRPIAAVANTALVSTPTSYRGYSITDTSGAGNTVKIYDNTTNSGTVLASFALAANGAREFELGDGTRCEKGIYLQATGAVEGHVRIG